MRLQLKKTLFSSIEGRRRLEFGGGTCIDETAVLKTLFSSIEERRRLEFGGGTYNDETAVKKNPVFLNRREKTFRIWRRYL